ncbi:MAG: PQQ-dependent sugar dehydrogenase [Kofleriaceae bacterium]
MTIPRIATSIQLSSFLALGLAGSACGGSEGGSPSDATISIDAPTLPSCASPVSGSRVSFRSIGRVVGAALLATSPPGDERLFVLEHRGAIRIFKDERLQPELFLDLSSDANGPVVTGAEQGLLGLAFHPDYATNGRFFVYYTAGDPDHMRNVVARCQRSADDPDRAEPTCEEILAIPDFAANHNGGMIEFGRDGYLYIGTGDGGSGGDPHQNGQSIMDGSPTPDSVALLGKILRIDVDRPSGGRQYGIPPTNPFANGGGAPEIFIIGLRNPWRWSFDRETGDMWIADVGQDRVEEVTALRPAQQRGANLGWRMYEGNDCYDGPCDPTGKTFPQDTRHHGDGWISITGGQVYRGTCYPDLVGWYFYSDYGLGGLSRARLLANDTFEIEDLSGDFPAAPVSLHEDARGELYMTNLDGEVFHLEASP